ncbi:MAG: hypothetical protein Pg6B_09220 [Candidatus Azobacteroides pseudotrichonymphae]|nr:MAG: hypothetical protein Pg6B_09220 [Candidatus Azobacteroides pseudotrichonymphae]
MRKIPIQLSSLFLSIVLDKNNRSSNITNIFGPSRTFAQSDDAFEKMALNKLKQVYEILTCVYVKSSETYEEAMETVVKQFNECDVWEKIINRAIEIYED